MVAYLEKSEGSEGFHEIIDFLSASHIHYALTASPTIYTSLIEQFWQTTTLCTIDDGVLGITTTIDRKVKITVSEVSIRRHLKLEDSEGIPSLLTAELFEQLDLMGVYSLGREEGSMQQHELMELVTKLTDRIGVLEKDLQRKARVVLSEDEDAAEDSSKQGRKIYDIDTDPTISLVQPQQDMEYDFDATASIPVTTTGLEISTANIAVSTADAAVTTASASISTVSPPRVSTAKDISGAKTLFYIRRSASKAKDKGKAIIQESEPPKKIKKKVQGQTSIYEELAKKVFEEEQARFNAKQEARHKAEQEQERIDFETALELQRYHALQNRPFFVAEVRKNMCMYLKNQGGYKLSHFKGMSYEEIRPIFERVWDQIQSFVPMDSEKEKGSEKKTGGRRKKSLARKRARETLSEESAKKQKLEDDAEKEELQVYLNIVPEEESLDVESLATKQDVLELYRLVKDRFQTASPKGYDLLLWGDLKTLIGSYIDFVCQVTSTAVEECLEASSADQTRRFDSEDLIQKKIKI
ncbi:hypothetical protein Tco_1204985 [Tanacetum coccineum]